MIFCQFEIAEMAGFLKYGISGLSAIAFILSFFLLNRESGRPKPRPEMLRSIRMFMALTVILGLVSGIATIINPSKTDDEAPRKPKSKTQKTVISKLIEPRQKWQIEVFYDKEAKPLAQQIDEELNSYKDYETKITQLTTQKKKGYGVSRSQIRHEAIEKEAAVKLYQRLQKILPQDVAFQIKQISSSSPDYLSVFVCK